MIEIYIDTVVGYMLKVLKAGVLTDIHKPEFNAIRHGNYYDFIQLVGGDIPFMVIYHKGAITNETSARRGDVDFAGLLKAGPSLQIFYSTCISAYGKIIDPDISDTHYKRMATFEIALRMHANNNGLLNDQETLKVVIDKFSDFQEIQPDVRNELHQGRRFINMVKHGGKTYNSWSEGLEAFNRAYGVIEENRWTIL